MRQQWTARLGAVDFPLGVAVQGTSVALGASDGTVAVLDAGTGTHSIGWVAGLDTPTGGSIALDDLVASGEIDRLLRSGARFAATRSSQCCIIERACSI